MTVSPGDLLANKYRIEAEIGRGAFGRGYRARDIALDVPRAINPREVAGVKELHRGEDDLGSTLFADYGRRFEREARVQADLRYAGEGSEALKSSRRGAGQGRGNGARSSAPTSRSLRPASSVAGALREPRFQQYRSD